MWRMGKQIHELDGAEFPLILAECPGIARESYRIAGDVTDSFKCGEIFEKSP